MFSYYYHYNCFSLNFSTGVMPLLKGKFRPATKVARSRTNSTSEGERSRSNSFSEYESQKRIPFNNSECSVHLSF